MSSYRPRSTKSIRSVSDLRGELKKVVFEDNLAVNFEERLRDLCLNYEATFYLRVIRDLQTVPSTTTVRKVKRRYTASTPLGPITSEDQDTDTTGDFTTATTVTAPTHVSFLDTVVVRAVYDNLNRLAEVCIADQKEVPRVLLQVITLLAPLYPFMSKITFKNCVLDKYSVYEVTKIVDVGSITELYFDGSTSAEGNYAILLDSTSRLRVLSLARCDITDVVCEQLADKLTFSQPASTNLLVLNLSSNAITDAGAKSLAFTLRTNRNLRHLNLAGNRITDVGAIAIFESLSTFPLTYEEYMGKRVRYSDHVKQQMQLAKRFMEEQVDTVSLDTKASARSEKPKGKRNASQASAVPPLVIPKSRDQTYQKQRAEMLAAELMGSFVDPFEPRATILRDGYRYCLGNLALSSLNLAYNDLGYHSLKKLEEVVKYQRGVRQNNQSGLLKVVIEGNNLPVDAVEYKVIGDILSRFMCSRLNRKSEMGRRKSRGIQLTTRD